MAIHEREYRLLDGKLTQALRQPKVVKDSISRVRVALKAPDANGMGVAARASEAITSLYVLLHQLREIEKEARFAANRESREEQAQRRMGAE